MRTARVTSVVMVVSAAGGGLLAAVGGTVAVAGVYWDDAWHTDRGRDGAAITPHLVLYGGVLATSLVLAVWGFRAWRSTGGGAAGALRVMRHRALALAALGGASVLGAAPVDAHWHARYGRDAVLWSPPHMLAVVASVALSSGLLACLRAVPGRVAEAARVLAGAGLLAALLLPVLEFDSDVPQFPVWTYLPVTTGGFALAALLVRDLLPGRWPLTVAAAAWTCIKGAVAVGLVALGMTGTVVVPAAVPAVVDDILARRGWGPAARLPVLAVTVPLAWLPALLLQRHTASVPSVRDLPPALAGSAAAVVAVLTLSGRWRPPVGPAAATLLLLLGTVALLPAAAPAALAHDPGQGEPVARADLRLLRTGDGVALDVALRVEGCSWRGVGAVARRAGSQVRVPLVDDGRCRLKATFPVPDDGRWFFYVELADRSGRTAETWASLPGGESATSVAKDVYLAPAGGPDDPTEALLGTLLYVAVVALVVATIRLASRAGERAGGSGPFEVAGAAGRSRTARSWTSGR